MKKKFLSAPLVFIVLMILFAQCSNLNNVDYAIYADAPVFSLDQGQYFGTQTVTMTSATEGAYIRYTLDGTEPTKNEGTLYEAAVTIDQNSTLKAVAYKFGYTISRVTTAQYSIIIWKGTIATAPANPEGGWAYYNSTEGISYIYDGTTWQILAKDGADSTNSGAFDINVKLGGVDIPNGTKDFVIDQSMLDSNNLLTFTIENLGTDYFILYGNPIKVKVTGNGFTLISDVTADTLMPGKKTNFKVMLTTTNTLLEIQYSASISISNTDLDEDPYSFTLKAVQPSAPVINFNSETQTASFDCSTDGAAIYYTIDGSTPTTSSTLYTGEFTVENNARLKALVVKDGYMNSSIRAYYDNIYPFFTAAVDNKYDLAIKGAFANGWGTCFAFVNTSDILKVTIPVDITADSGAFGFVNASNKDTWLGSIQNIVADGTLQGMYQNYSNGNITGLTGVGNYEFYIDVTYPLAPIMKVTKK